jgi:hypothetical protein
MDIILLTDNPLPGVILALIVIVIIGLVENNKKCKKTK